MNSFTKICTKNYALLMIIYLVYDSLNNFPILLKKLRIRRLFFLRPTKKSDVTKRYFLEELQFWISGEWEVLLRCYYSQV